MKVETKANVGQTVFFMSEKIHRTIVMGIRITHGVWVSEHGNVEGTSIIEHTGTPPLIEYLLQNPKGNGPIGEYFTEDEIGTSVEELLKLLAEQYNESQQSTDEAAPLGELVS